MPWSPSPGGSLLAVDLGTSRTRVRGTEKLLFEGASAIAVDTSNHKVVAIGDHALRMVGRTPPAIEAIAPVSRGVITHFDAATRLLWYAMGGGRRRIRRAWMAPRVVMGVPARATPVQRRAAEESLAQAGARAVHLLPKGALAAIGAGLPVRETTGSLVVDIGAGTTEVAALAFGTVLATESTNAAGDAFSATLGRHLLREHSVALSPEAAKAAKVALSRAAKGADGEQRLRVGGRDRVTDLPKTALLTPSELRSVVEPEIESIAAAVSLVLGRCPTAVVDDITARGLVLTGGGSLLNGLPERLGKAVEMVVHHAVSPRTSVADGATRWLTDFAPGERQQMLSAL
ncbi:rod shape-determining protein [Streptomyces sp. TP-A0874]|uniref:rod shape-determining protein n=1 Tax=Streptomyces sp. TP-A0874 TaxID=549819 RepID=UPI0008533921|nr:rod shape-determining protein [Streptomyces sp. TP-A0874]